MKKILLTLAAVAMSAAMMAATYVKTYDFAALGNDLDAGTKQAFTLGGDYSYAVATGTYKYQRISLGENNFDGRFAVTRTDEGGWCLRNHSNSRYRGLYCGYPNSRQLVICNLEAGDKISIKYSDERNLRFSNYSMVSDATAETNIISETEYTIATAGDLILTTETGSDGSTHIYNIVITMQADHQYVGALPNNSTYLVGYNWAAAGVTFKLGGSNAWTRDAYSDSWGSWSLGFTYTASPADRNCPITITSAFSGILSIYGQFQYQANYAKLVDNTNGVIQESGNFAASAAWKKLSFVVEAGHSYTLSCDNQPRLCGFTFKTADPSGVAELGVGGNLFLSDDKAFAYDAAFTGNVIINRSFEAGSDAYTLCLPFDLPVENFETCLGAGVKVYKFANLAYDALGFDEVTTNKMAAGFPYLVVFGVNKSYLSFKNVTIAENQGGKGERGDQEVEIFKGNLTYNKDIHDMHILNDGNRIVQAGTGEYSRLDAFRGYFDFSEVTLAPDPATPGSSLVPRRIVLGGNAATGIESIDGTPILNIDAPMYNIMGQQVDASYHGVVIQNGHKFMLQ